MTPSPCQKSPLSPSFHLGIECGGTRSVALLVDSHGTLCRRIQTGPGNARLLSDSELLALFHNLAERLRSPSSQIAVTRPARTPCHAEGPLPLASVGIGMAGVLTEADRQRVRTAARQVWPDVPCWVGNDLETALAAAGSLPGTNATVILISGTGSCAYGSNRTGTVCKAGGWGHILGDRGSAYDISLKALRRVMLHFDQTGRWPVLGQKILARLLLNQPKDLVAWAQSADKTNLASVGVAVFEAAAHGDRIARSVLREAACCLAEDALACARRLTRNGQPVRFVFTGGVLLKQPSFALQVKRLIQSRWSRAVVETLDREGAWGAIHKGRKQSERHGCHPPAEDVEAVGRSSPSPQPSAAKADDLLPQPTDVSPTERRNPRSAHLDRMSIAQAVRLMIEEEQCVRAALLKSRHQIARAIRLIVAGMRGGGRLFYVGAGTSGRLGVLDASECPPTFRTPPELVQGIMAGGQTALWLPAEGAEDDLDAGVEAIRFRGVRRGDVVVGIAASGRTPFVWGALRAAATAGAATILLCFNPHLRFPRSPRPDVIINPSVGPEVLTGSTRLKAGTATKLVLNMFTTLSMVQLGKVLGNLMVDLNPSNTKLRDRAVRILGELTGSPPEDCRAALERTGWVVKKALRHLAPRNHLKKRGTRPGSTVPEHARQSPLGASPRAH